MKFSEAMQELLKGKKVRMADWDKDQYITSGLGGYVTWPDGSAYNPHTSHIMEDWEEYHSLKAGSRFVKDGQFYRVVLINPLLWGLIDTSEWAVVYSDRTLNDLENRISSLGLQQLD